MTRITQKVIGGGEEYVGLLLKVACFLTLLFMQGQAQEVTVSTSGKNVYVSQQASLTCAFTGFPAEIKTVKWYRNLDVNVNDVILTYDNVTSVSTPEGALLSRVEGYMSATSHELRINTTVLGDERNYFCTVTDVNNNTATNDITQKILYYKDGLEVSVDGVSSLDKTPIFRLTPFDFTIVCFLPDSRPAATFSISLVSLTDNTTMPLTENTTVTSLSDQNGVTNTTVTVKNVQVTTLGEYLVTCTQVFPFMTSSKRTVERSLSVVDSIPTTAATNETADSDPCISAPCQNGGLCSNNTSGFICTCPTTHKGVVCGTVVPPLVSPCLSSPCANGGTCQADANLTSYTCICKSCYNGTLCDNLLTDLCASSPCVSGFTCAIDCPTYSCACTGTAAECKKTCAVRSAPPPLLTEVYGRTVNLTCDPPQSKPVLVQWFKQGQAAALLMGNSYGIENITAADTGVYYCKVMGSCSSVAYVTVNVGFEIQPNKTENISMEFEKDKTHTLTCSAIGVPEPLLYWEWTPSLKSQKTDEVEEPGVAAVNGSNITTTSLVNTTTTSPVTASPPNTKQLTPLSASPLTLTLPEVTSSNDGTYICRANVMNLTEDDLIIKVIEVTIDSGDTFKPKPGCCKDKKGMAPWKIAIIVLFIVIIIVIIIIAIIFLLKKGKEGAGPCVCCFTNTVHPEVKDVKKEQNGGTPSKYTKYDDAYEMDKPPPDSYDRYDNDHHQLVKRDPEDTWSKACSDEEEVDDPEPDQRYNNRRERDSKTPSPKSLNPIGSRARQLPPLDMNMERKKNRKKKKRRKPDPEEQEHSEDESPTESRRDYQEDN